jgi:Bacteriophage tail sheath protein
MADPIFGISIRKVDEGARPVLAADLSTIGIIGPATLADPVLFPIDTPVFLNSNDQTKTRKLGEMGYLSDAVRGINDQLGETQFAARIVIVRTAEGTDPDPAIKLQQTISKIAGDSLNGTGMWAFLKSAQKLGFTPRILTAPGYTSQMANGVGAITRTVPGAGYVMDHLYPVEFSGGGPDAVQATGHAYGLSSGQLGPVSLELPGAWYDTPPTIEAPPPGYEVGAATVVAGGIGYGVGEQLVLANQVILDVLTIGAGGEVLTTTVNNKGFVVGTDVPPATEQDVISSSGSGTGATFTTTWTETGTTAEYDCVVVAGANPIVAGATSVCNQLLGHMIVESAGSSFQNDIDWRETMQSHRLIALSGGCRVMDPVSSYIVIRPLAPRMAGILVRRDHETGAPFHSAANQAVQGIISPNREIGFNLTDSANEAQELFAMNIGCVIRGEVGSDFALASGGFVLVSTDNVGEDPLWQMYNVMRGRDYIHLGMLRALRFFLGRYNIVGHTVQAILNTMNFFLRDLKADNHILGYKVNFRTAGNSPEQIRLGHLTVGFAAEEPPVLKHLTIESARYREAIDAMVADLSAQLSLAS